MKTREEIYELMKQAENGTLPSDFQEWNLCDENGWTVAHVAATWNTLPKNFNQWNLADKDGWTVAHSAAYQGNLPKYFKQWDLQTNDGTTVAHIAAMYGHLLDNFKNWNLKNSKGQTVYDIARLYNHLPKHSFEANITMEDILKEAVRRNTIYQIQYADYSPDTWTAQSLLTKERMEKILVDFSVRKIRLEFEF